MEKKKKHIIWIVSIILIIVLIIGIIFLYYHFNEENNTANHHVMNDLLILTLMKTGGTHDAAIKLEIFNNKSYKLYNHNLPIRHGNLSNINYHQALEISKNINKLKNVHCPPLDTNLYNYSLESNGVTAELGQVSSACISSLSQTLFNNIKDLDSLTSL